MKKEYLEESIRLRHALHAHPELSLKETETINRIQEFLRTHTSFEIVEKDGWFYAWKKGAPNGKRICFRADMDALPIEEDALLPYASKNAGISHRCGHDGHCAALCGLALELEDLQLENTIVLLFQPAEEIGAGAELCKEIITEQQIDEIYAFHNLGGYSEGMIIYKNELTQPASEGVRISLKGKTTHAANPENGISPIGTLAKIALFVNELNCIEDANLKLCTVTGLLSGNGDFGIAPGEGEISITLRAAKESDLKEMETKLIGFSEKLAKEESLQLKVEISDYFPETKNDDICIGRVKKAADMLHIPCREMETLWRASEDFGHYLKACPGAIVYLGNGEDYAPLHTVAYDFNDKILEPAVDLFCELAKMDS